MGLFPTGALGRLLFVLIIFLTISYLALNIVSFAGNPWITYNFDSVKFGLWRVCDTTAPNLCNYWTSQFATSLLANTFNNEKPG